MAHEEDFLGMAIASERIVNWIEEMESARLPIRRQQALLDLVREVSRSDVYREEARAANVLAVAARVLDSIPHNDSVRAAYDTLARATMGEDRSFRTKEFVFGGVSVSIREGRLGDGLGARVWAIAAGACNDLARHPDFVSGRRVLEIGAGCGLCGLLAAKLGAESVVLSDVGLPVLRLLHGAAQDNFPERLDTFDESNRAECNGCPEQQAAIPAANAVGAWSVGNIHVRELDWRQSLHHLDAPRPNLEAGNCRGGDGREPPLPQLPEEEVYDVVLGTDVVYEREHATMVAAVLKHRLQAQGRALVSAAVRDCALFEQFEQELDRREMSWRKDAVTCIPELLDDRADYEGGFCHYFVQHATGEAVWNWP